MKNIFLGVVSAIAFSLSATAAKAADELTVAYFPEWPMPFQFAQAHNIYDKALGVKVNWVSFDAGTAMAAAMASGDVQIAVSMGVTPFLTAVSAGQDLQAVAVAVGYSDNDNCVVRDSLEIDASNAKELEGKQVGLPLGTAAHTGFLAQMEHFGIDPDSMKIVDMAPVYGAAAFAAGNLDMVCGWGGPLRRMKEFGSPLLAGLEKEEVVGKVYDIIAVNGSWAAENEELVARFLRQTEDMNRQYKAGSASFMLPGIAAQAGMELLDAAATASTFVYPSSSEQLSSTWLRGFMATNFKEVSDKRAERGEIVALESYQNAVNSDYLKAASEL